MGLIEDEIEETMEEDDKPTHEKISYMMFLRQLIEALDQAYIDSVALGYNECYLHLKQIDINHIRLGVYRKGYGNVYDRTSNYLYIDNLLSSVPEFGGIASLFIGNKIEIGRVFSFILSSISPIYRKDETFDITAEPFREAASYLRRQNI